MAAPMMISNAFLLIFAVAFMGCVLATPVVTRIAVWSGAIDRPDHFRRIHKGATPRLGGLGLAFGLLVGVSVVILGGYLDGWEGLAEWGARQWPVVAAALIVLALGFVDDTRGVGPRVKLSCQALAVLVLYFGGTRIQFFDVLGWAVDFSHPSVTFELLGRRPTVSLPSLFVTMLWFLGCMNIWNLIDGMDGLASGVGLLVSGTLTLVAIHHDNIGVAITASALAGSLAGFLLYNWHPACIFLGDSGSLLIGLLIGVIGVQGSFKGASSISILFPILAMGLPISDTALAIFRRWVRNLPLSAADRRHVHHLLIGLGLNPRQAAALLYCFTGFLCGVVLLGVALKNERLAFIMGISGCLAFLLILTSRLNELSSLRGDLQARLVRGRQERFASKVTWEAIQRIELSHSVEAICGILEKATRQLGCDVVKISALRDGTPVIDCPDGAAEGCASGRDDAGLSPTVSGPTAIFRLSSGQDLLLTVSLHQSSGSPMTADIAFRFLQRLSLATAERLERLLLASGGGGGAESGPARSVGGAGPLGGDGRDSPVERSQTLPEADLAPFKSATTRALVAWVRVNLGLGAPTVARHPSLSEE
ncbi:MAG: undecaprenyl/decaprenyl-phosphate alpha-N-acetylglucosaminyl 1-phosphate transferase [Planctomycetia bacterium]|nr:undecaprenyl/decaprenyl-phosphate alpha-N-acetylglucosaminyl 1-phosphate transferase [Planctomycetia bacterium]